MRKISIGLLVLLFAVTSMTSRALAQQEILGLPAVQSGFTKLDVSWETKLFQDFNTPELGEGRYITANVAFDPNATSLFKSRDVYVRFEGGETQAGIVPCLVFFVPGESLFIFPDKSGFKINSIHPKESGVRNVLTDQKGVVIEDVTGDITFFDLRLTLRNGVWRLNIELEKRNKVFQTDWVLPGGSIGTSVVIGDSGGFASPKKVEMFHSMD